MKTRIETIAAINNSNSRCVPAIAIENVTKRYGSGAPILENLSLTLAPGEFVSILGPSGCGKSTLLRLIAGLSPVTAGTIAVDGMTPLDAREIMSFIFQDATLLPWRTVRANVGLSLELERVARERRSARVDTMLKLVGLTHASESYPMQLSGGMKMRVSIARALVTNPRVLLLDEPFAALDEMTRDSMNEELLRLQREQRWTVVFVTHSVAEAVFLSSRIVVLATHPGRVHADIPIEFSLTRSAELRSADAFDLKVASVSKLLRSVYARG